PCGNDSSGLFPFIKITHKEFPMKTSLGSFALATGVAGLMSVFAAADANAATKHYRLVWDKDGSNSAVIGFSPNGSSSNPYVSYGYSTSESSWSNASVDATRTFGGSITSHFVRLENL